MQAASTKPPLKLTDIEKSAIVMMAIGEDAAAEVVKSLSQLEINLLAVAMTRISDVPRDAAIEVLREFVEQMQQDSLIGIGADQYVQGVLDRALGPEKAGRLVGRLKLGDYSAGIEAIQSHDPRALADLIKAEHPQILAMIFAYLEPEQAQAVVQHLPDEVVEQLVPRLAMLDTISPAVFRELNEALEQLLAGETGVDPIAVGGVDAAARLLNRMGNPRALQVLQVIQDIDPDVAQTLSDKMFVFEDLISVDDRNFQVLLRSIDQALLTIALKGTPPRLQLKFLGNLSQRAADMLREEMEARGPVRFTEVEAARKEIVAAALALEREGKIILRTNADDLVS